MSSRTEIEALYADLWEKVGVYQFHSHDTSKPIFSATIHHHISPPHTCMLGMQ